MFPFATSLTNNFYSGPPRPVSRHSGMFLRGAVLSRGSFIREHGAAPRVRGVTNCADDKAGNAPDF